MKTKTKLNYLCVNLYFWCKDSANRMQRARSMLRCSLFSLFEGKVMTKILSLQTFPPFFLQLIATILPKGDKSGKPLQKVSCSYSYKPRLSFYKSYAKVLWNDLFEISSLFTCKVQDNFLSLHSSNPPLVLEGNKTYILELAFTNALNGTRI